MKKKFCYISGLIGLLILCGYAVTSVVINKIYTEEKVETEGTQEIMQIEDKTETSETQDEAQIQEITRDHDTQNTTQIKDIEEENNFIANEVEYTWQWFIEPGEYEYIMLLNESYISVEDKSGKSALMNRDGELLTDYEYKYMIGVGDGIITAMSLNDEYLFLNEEGEILFHGFYEDAKDFREGYAAIKKDGRWGFADKNGICVIDYQFEDVKNGFEEGYAAAKKDGKWGFIDTDGTCVIDYQFDDVKKGFSEGYAAVKQNNKWGYIDQNGQYIIEPTYEDAGNFSEGLAAVMNKIDRMKQWAYINSENEIVIDYKLYDISGGHLSIVGEFHDGHAFVTDVLYSLIDRQGNAILGLDSFFLAGDNKDTEFDVFPAYDYPQNGDGEEDMVKRYYGMMDMQGNMVVPFQFYGISELHGNLVLVQCESDGEILYGIIEIMGQGTEEMH